jgi:hypothetical protein
VAFAWVRVFHQTPLVAALLKSVRRILGVARVSAVQAGAEQLLRRGGLGGG